MFLWVGVLIISIICRNHGCMYIYVHIQICVKNICILLTHWKKWVLKIVIAMTRVVFLLLYLLILTASVCTCVCTFHSICVEISEWLAGVNSLLHQDTGHWIPPQLGRKCFYLQSQLSSPGLVLIIVPLLPNLIFWLNQVFQLAKTP